MFTEKIFAATIVFATMSSTPSAAEICQVADECGISEAEALEAYGDVFRARRTAMEDIAEDMAKEMFASYETEFANY